MIIEFFFHMSKDEAINLMKISDLKAKVKHYTTIIFFGIFV